MISITDSNFPTAESRLEKFYSWADHACHFLKRGVELDARGYNIIVVRNRFYWDTESWEKEWFYTHNIATDVADQFYAQKAAEVTPTNDFLGASNRCELGNPASADALAKADTYSALGSPIVASRKTITATYPLVPDTDGDNTGGGADIVSWDYAWTTGDFTATSPTIKSGVIHLGAGAPVGGTVLLSHYNFSTGFEKTGDDTLKVFHNHRMNGV